MELLSFRIRDKETIRSFSSSRKADKSIHMIRAVVFTAEGYPVYRLTGAWSHSLYLEEYDQSVYSSSSLHPSAKASDRTSSSSPSRDSSSSSASQGNSHTSNSRKAPKSVPGKAFKDYWRSEGPPPSDSPDNKLLQLLDSCWDAVPVIENSRRLVWRPAARPSHSDIYYGFGYLTMELNEIRSEYDPANPDVCIARTDSRFRPDQRSYEEGRVEEAIEEKTRLEEKQR
ncbi:oxysterol-binding protein [Cystoisospora suis]|uniref:Oxysterol-binding protein n=1 Tax=Cystoisospora suis TaxID=483139 RepID=A0A2C6KGW8_9APIC|nr:oxysterol-binding protein [Cystoisospora suis]